MIPLRILTICSVLPLLLAHVTLRAGGKEDYLAIEPILMDGCYDCHGDGSEKGDFALDDFDDIEDYLTEFDPWFEVWKNVRSNLMPPADKKQLTPEERTKLLGFIEKTVFKIDSENPDPGRVTIRRLNREEYRYTIKDLVGHDINVGDILPPDDTGYGFDTIGDVLSISPLLMEKYLEAAEQIVAASVPTGGIEIIEWWHEPKQFSGDPNKAWKADWTPLGEARKLVAHPWVGYDGEYEVSLDYNIRGSNEPSDQSATLKWGVGDKVLGEAKLAWTKADRLTLKGKVPLKQGKENAIWFATETGAAPKEGQKKLGLSIANLRIRGPLDGSHKEYPWSARRIFSEGPPPSDPAALDAHREKLIRKFATRAYRRPVDDATIKRLTKIARDVSEVPGHSYEEGIAEAITAILVSPRFLMRAEIQPEPDNPDKIVPIDEYALASRLSYFLWTSMPDEELMKLAEEGKLRSQLRAQVDRMLDDPKSDRMILNFVGQWLRTRDVQTMSFNERVVVREKDFEKAIRIFNQNLRLSMRQETEKFFAYVLRENRPVTELLTARYTFLNESLANWYQVDGVKGSEMRKVDLPDSSPRGGLLNHASFLLVTSNPTRTSPVNRGLFVLDNFLATPAPPAAPNVPALEAAAGPGNKKPLSLRELLALHSEQKMCASCHARMDPIGLALENYNAVGLWRDTEHGEPIDTAGELMTGEKFRNAKELAQVLATSRKGDFLRAITEKVLTYAVGRGMEYYDAPTVDKIIANTEKNGDSFRELFYGVVESAPFQKRRGDSGYDFTVSSNAEEK